MPRVLVVEDDEQVRVLAEAIIQDAGYRTVSAATAQEALALLKGDISVEAIFTDIDLVENTPSGIDLAIEAPEARPKIKVLYTTGAGITDGMQALFVESSAFLPKPYTPDQLTAAITELFAAP